MNEREWIESNRKNGEITSRTMTEHETKTRGFFCSIKQNLSPQIDFICCILKNLFFSNMSQKLISTFFLDISIDIDGAETFIVNTPKVRNDTMKQTI